MIRESSKRYIGKRYNLLIIVDVESVKKNNRSTLYVDCTCGCGNQYRGKLTNVKYGIKKSCGCMYSSKIKDRKLYTRWKAMRARCNNKNGGKYHRYGGRGITFCKDWHVYKNFESWALSNGYKPELSLDRIDNDGNYSPDNCRWVSNIKQAKNRVSNIFITIDGKTKCLVEWCNKYNISYQAIRARIQDLKWDPIRAIKTPVRKFRGAIRTN